MKIKQTAHSAILFYMLFPFYPTFMPDSTTKYRLLHVAAIVL